MDDPRNWTIKLLNTKTQVHVDVLDIAHSDLRAAKRRRTEASRVPLLQAAVDRWADARFVEHGFSDAVLHPDDPNYKKAWGMHMHQYFSANPAYADLHNNPTT